MPVRRRAGRRPQFLCRFLKILRKPRAIIRIRASREKECQRQRLPPKLAEGDRLPKLVGESIIELWVPGGRGRPLLSRRNSRLPSARKRQTQHGRKRKHRAPITDWAGAPHDRSFDWW